MSMKMRSTLMPSMKTGKVEDDALGGGHSPSAKTTRKATEHRPPYASSTAMRRRLLMRPLLS